MPVPANRLRRKRLRGSVSSAAVPPAALPFFPQGILDQRVELLLNGVWTDISKLVYYRDNIAIVRGIPDESTQTPPGTAAMTINNRCGKFSPRNPSGAYYGQIGRNTPLRVSVGDGLGGRSYRFCGEVPAWPQRWTENEADVYVPIQVSGILRRLGQRKPLNSAMFRAVTRLSGSASPVAYWPMEDLTKASVFASGLSAGSPMAITSGHPTFASDSSILSSGALPVINSAVWTGVVPRYSVGTMHQMIFLISIPSGGDINDTLPVSFQSSGTIGQANIHYFTASGGSLIAEFWDQAGALITEIPLPFPGVTGANGKQFAVRISVGPVSGGNLNVGVDVMQSGGIITSGSDVALGTNLGRIQSVTVNQQQGFGAGSAKNIAVGHVFLQKVNSPISAWINPLFGYVGETAGNRINRICNEEGIAFTSRGDLNDTVSMGPQTALKITDLLQECVDADRGLLYEPRDFLGLGYRTRVSMQSQQPAITLAYNQAQLSPPLEPVDDDQQTKNDITVTRAYGGSSSRQVLTNGALSVNAPPNGVGLYDTSITLNVQTDAKAADLAGWLLHMFTTDEPRYPQINLNMARPEIAALFATILGLGDGDRVTVTGLPTWLPPGPISQIRMGNSEKLTNDQFEITLNTVPESPFQVGIVGDPVYAQVDTDGSQLSSGIAPTDTTMLVATPVSSDYPLALWTTSASDMPFDILMGGEQMTVTNITGSSSPQTFTVTRGVNGVVRSHSAGEDLRLFSPTNISL